MARLLGTLCIMLAAGFLLNSAHAQGPKSIDVDGIFKKLDTNNDGKLSKDEFLKLADSFKNKEKAREKLAIVFDKIDPKNEGLTRERFRMFMESVSARKKDKDHMP
jgi:Ca2+-binding EF-hand superfamily protein